MILRGRPGAVQTEFAADMPVDLLIVARHHFHGDAQLAEGSQRFRGARLRQTSVADQLTVDRLNGKSI